jgi:hypothetical protein
MVTTNANNFITILTDVRQLLFQRCLNNGYFVSLNFGSDGLPVD